MAVIIDTERGGESEPVDVSAGTVLTLYVYSKEGSHIDHTIELEISPDNTNWFKSGVIVTGQGAASVECVANYARAKVDFCEKKSSQAYVEILSR